MPQNQKESWHLRKELSVGTILSLGSLIFFGAIGYGNLSNSVEAMEKKVNEPHPVSAAQVARIEERQASQGDNIEELKDDVREIKNETKRLPAIEQALIDIKEQLQRVSEN